MHDGSATSPMYMANVLASHLHLTLYTIPPLLSNRIGIPGLTWLENSNNNGDRCALMGVNQENTFTVGPMEPKCKHIAPVASLFSGDIVPLLCSPSLYSACHCHMNKLNSYKFILHKQVLCHSILCLITLNCVSCARHTNA